MDGAPIVAFENVGMRYGPGPEVLHDISFALPKGSFHFLTGASGAGKSTLLKLIHLGARPTTGRILLFGHDVATMRRQDLPNLRRQIGIVFQDFRLLDHLSTRDNVALPLRIAGAAEADIRAHVDELLTWVGLGNLLDASPAMLSGGQKKRAAIARAVIARPRLLLADEPTGNVDDRMAVRLLHLFQELNRLGSTVIISSHNDMLLSRFPHPVLHLDEGRLAPRAAASGRS